jgi:hypothetical protein
MLHRCQLLANIPEDQAPMATQHQRQAANSHNEELQHGAIVVGIGAQFNSDAFWRGSANVSVRTTTMSSSSMPDRAWFGAKFNSDQL